MDQLLGVAAETFQPSITKYLVAFLFVPSSLGKLFGASFMSKLWPTIPRWWWPIGGLWEAIGVAAILFLDRPDVGVPMLLANMGGALACTTMVGFRPEFWPPVMFGTLVPSIVALHNNLPIVDKIFFPSMGLGFVTAVVLHLIGRSKKIPKKN